MSVLDVSITFLAAILSVAYPILIEVISRLDEKYDSIIITDLFYEEKSYRIFKFSIYAGILFTVLYFLRLGTFHPIPSNIWLLNNSAMILLTLAVLTVIISFFYLINKIFIYYRPLNLVKYFIHCHDKIEICDDSDYNNRYFSALTDISLLSIRKQNRKIAKELSSFFYLRFKEIRDKNDTPPLEYPAFYYELVYKSIEDLAPFKTNRLQFLEDYTAGSIYLLGEASNTVPSDLTYRWIWNNQRLALKFDRDDFVLEHWKNAHQFFDMSLEPVDPDYSDYPDILNKGEVETREAERKKFFVFHTILGALMLYTGKYKTLGKIFDYSQSIPPRYVLLPETMQYIFELYIQVTDTFDSEFDHVSFQYSFPDIHGIQADERINQAIAEYLALLFVRQYSIVPYLVYQTPLQLPAIPGTMGAKKKWLEKLPYFRKLVTRIMENKALLAATQLDFITPEYLEKSKQEGPVELLATFEGQLTAAIQDAEVNQDISEAKRAKYIDATKEILSSVIAEYKELVTQTPIEGETDSSFINGQIQVVDRSSLADNQGVENINVHSILAEKLGEKFQRWVSESFFVMKKERHLLTADQITEALEKLNLQEKKVCIISFWSELKEYKDIRTINFRYANRRLFRDALFILPEKDLPSITFRELKPDLVSEYQLQKIVDEFNIYASLINLNESQHLHEDVYKSGFDGDIRKQALMTIFLHAEFRSRKNSKCVMLQVASAYREDGIATNIKDIKEF